MNKCLDGFICYKRGLFLSLLMSVPSLLYASDLSAKRLSEQAESELRAGNATRAEMLFGQAMQESSNDVAPAVSVAEIYIAQHRFNDAARLIDKTMQFHSTDYRVWKTRAQLRLVEGKESEAVADFEKAFSLGGNEDPYVLHNLQRHYEQTGNGVRKKQMDNNLQWLRIKGVR